MTAAPPPRVALVLDGASPAAERQARALGGFLRDGLQLPADVRTDAVTHLFYADEGDKERLTALAPTRDVRLIRTPPHRTDLVAAALSAFEAGGGGLFIFPGGPLGTELAARLAARAGGALLTEVFEAEATDDVLACRRTVYSGHLTGRFELRARPWCITLDAGWSDSPPQPASDHLVRAECVLGDEAGSASSPLQDVEMLETPRTGDLETAKLLVVAGRGAGSSGGVERIRAAAARLGAAFGVTRPVVMSAWAPPDRQIGVSGTRAAPAVCIVAGASGAPAFLWGVERAAFVAAVDTDGHAPITGEADVVVLDDAVAVIEALADLAD